MDISIRVHEDFDLGGGVALTQGIHDVARVDLPDYETVIKDGRFFFPLEINKFEELNQQLNEQIFNLYQSDNEIAALIPPFEIDTPTQDDLLTFNVDAWVNVPRSNLFLSEFSGTLGITKGGTGQTNATNAFAALSPLTTAGDILGYSTGNARVPVGTDGQVLTVDTAQARKVKWATPTVTTPAGSNTQVQYNNSGAFGASSNFTFTSASNRLGIGSAIIQTPNSTSLFFGSTPNASYSGNTNTFVGLNAGGGNTVQYGNTHVGSGAGASTSSDAYFNTLIGYNTGNATTGRSNTFVGWNAGGANTSGYQNTFIGWNVGSNNVSGANSTFVGYGAGASNTANNGVAFGYNAGTSNSSGVENTYLGVLAGYQTTTGTSNTFVGSWAGQANTTGSYVVAVGQNAGYGSTGNGNTFLGRSAGSNVTSGTYNLMLGYGVQAESATGSNQTNVNDTFIGTSTEAFVKRNLFGVHYDSSNKVEISVASDGATTYNATGSNAKHIFNDKIQLAEGVNISFGTSTGTIFGSNTMEKFSFYGAPPTTQPSITGATTQLQVDSIVSALETLGLANDAR